MMFFKKMGSWGGGTAIKKILYGKLLSSKWINTALLYKDIGYNLYSTLYLTDFQMSSRFFLFVLP